MKCVFQVEDAKHATGASAYLMQHMFNLRVAEFNTRHKNASVEVYAMWSKVG